MLILGVDPGTVATGYGIVSKNGSSPTYVTGGVIRPGVKRTQSAKLLAVLHGVG